MSRFTRTQLFVALAGLVLIALTAFWARHLVRVTIAPVVLYVVWSIGVLVSGIPQTILWAAFLGVLLVLAVASLQKGQRGAAERPPDPPATFPGRVESLARTLRQMRSSHYFRQRLVRFLGQLTLDTLGHRDRLTPAEARDLLTNGRYDLDDDIHQLLEQGWRPQSDPLHYMASRQGWLQQWLDRFLPRRRPEAWDDPTVARLITFLEKELEVTRDP